MCVSLFFSGSFSPSFEFPGLSLPPLFFSPTLTPLFLFILFLSLSILFHTFSYYILYAQIIPSSHISPLLALSPPVSLSVFPLLSPFLSFSLIPPSLSILPLFLSPCLIYYLSLTPLVMHCLSFSPSPSLCCFLISTSYPPPLIHLTHRAYFHIFSPIHRCIYIYIYILSYILHNQPT